MTFAMDTSKPPKSAKQRILCWSLFVALLIIIVVGLLPFTFFRASKSAPTTEAINNARQIGALLRIYEEDYGQFPTTKLPEQPEILKKYIQQNRNDSNYILSHLIRLGYTESEELFYARSGDRFKKPDDIIDPDTRLLSRGECAFTYLTFQDGPFSNKESGNLPVLITPLLPNSDKADPDPYKGKAVYLRLDGSVQLKRINKDGKIMFHNPEDGKDFDLFQTGPGTPWGDKKPKFHHPLYLE